MASFFNVGTNPFSTPIGQRIEQATDAALASENWSLNMEICDMINESSEAARDAMKAIRKRLQQNAGKNNQVIMYTLTVLETCVKNCGKAFHVLVAHKDFIQELVKLIGPKNDPPVMMQEKVLSLIQIWADAFKNQPDLSGVTQMYAELKMKGIEFPQTDLDSTAPIYTPQRSVPELASTRMINQTNISPQNPVVATTPMMNTSTHLTAEQLTKLHSELEIVLMNMSILGEMLNELKPAEESVEDYQLLNDLAATCKEMQSRIVNLIDRITDDELTAELLRINDELNNLFLRYQRYEKNRSSSTAITSPSTVLGAAMGLSAISNSDQTIIKSIKAVESPKLVDISDNQHTTTDDLLNNFNKIDFNNGAGTVAAKNTDEFDMLAQSRTTSSGTSKLDALKDISNSNLAIANADVLSSVVERNGGELSIQGNKPLKESEIDEMAAWLGKTKRADSMEETVTSSEFDKFLEERAAAAENLPTVRVSNSLDNKQQQQTDKNNSKNTNEDLLLL